MEVLLNFAFLDVGDLACQTLGAPDLDHLRQFTLGQPPGKFTHRCANSPFGLFHGVASLFKELDALRHLLIQQGFQH